MARSAGSPRRWSIRSRWPCFPKERPATAGTCCPSARRLLEAVAPPPPGVSVRPVAIDYGDHADVVGWHSGEPGIANVMRVLGHRGHDAT